MFTGIINISQKARAKSQNGKEMRLIFDIPKGWKLKIGESINIDGICSTIINLTKNTFSVFYMSETLSKTSLLSLVGDHLYNLERALRASDLLSGHFVSGHIDTTAKVLKVKKSGESVEITFSLPKEFTKYLVYKGSVAVNGVSLTVGSVKEQEFTVFLIPHTLSITNLGNLKIGDLVNIEVDILSKYIEKLLSTPKSLV